KTSDQSTINAGDTARYTIVVTNTGAGIARNVTLSDTLPTNPGLSWTIDGGSGAAQCSIGSGTLTCNFGDLAPGEGKSVHIASPTTPATCGVIANTAEGAATNEMNWRSQEAAAARDNSSTATI